MFRALLITFTSLDLAEAGQGPRDYSNYTFADFTTDFGMGFGGEEYTQRRVQFADNLAIIRAHNAEFDAGLKSWWMDINQFAAMSREEFGALQTKASYRQTKPGPLSGLKVMAKDELPSSVDWREHGAVTAVKDQKLCGSCWAFAATETVESAYAIATQSLIELAPQTYVSCMSNPNHCGGSGGCEGAVAELAYNYTVHKGIPTEKDYPYMMGDFPCLPETTRPDIKPAVFVDGYVTLPPNDANALATALATVGPVAVSISTDFVGVQFYGGGIFTGCDGSGMHGMAIDHAVQAVGYSQDYWLIRNSWGASWGEAGYMRLTRAEDSTIYKDKSPCMGFACEPCPPEIDVAGACGVLSDSSYPTGARKAPTAPSSIVA